MATDSDPTLLAPDARTGAPELRLLDRRAFVGFPALPVLPGLAIADFALQIPDVSFPFNVSAGATRYQRKKLLFGFLELTVSSELVARKVAELTGRLAGLEELRLHFRPGYLEAQARLPAPERTPLTFKIAFDGDGERLAIYLYDVRLYGFSTTASVQVPGMVSNAVAALGLLPEVELRGASGFSARVLPALCQLAAVSRGYKMPDLDAARLSVAEVSGAGLRLRFTAGGLPPPAPPDEELLLTLEGARAFADAEGLVAQGKLSEAREAYLQAGDVQDAHPFAAERLLSLLVADPQAHELALDVAGTLSRRREKSPAALWGEAVVRERREEHARAAERFLALSALSRRASEEAAAFFAAEAAARSSRDHAPQMAVKALHELLGLRPDHLPSLKALARASDQARDRAGAVRAYRRIAALARDPLEAAEAHVRLARLCAQTEDDLAGARLHCEAALRLSPDQPEALLLLGELCHRSGEHLRALKALDRLREVGLARHELDRVGQANLLAGEVWELGLSQEENALLRYREAASLLPGEPEPLFRAARVAERLGKLQEALAGYQQALELAGPAPRTEAIRVAAHASHHAMARLSRTRLADPARAREHLEAALALDPRDAVALEELIPFFRASGRAPELAEALEKAAAVQEQPAQRAVLWAEAGELYRGRLQQPEKAERLLVAALDAEPENRLALEGLLALAESRREGGLLTRCLSTLARLTSEPRERAQRYRRLAVAARDLAFDLDLAAEALLEVLKAEPDDLSALGELCALQRKRSDMGGLASALESRARVAEAQGDKRLAAAALRELAGVLESRLGRVGEALVALEKAARLAPEAGVLLDLADLSLRCDRPEHARRALESLLSTLPRSAAPERLADVRLRLGRACDMLGDREAALNAYAQAFPLRRLDDVLAARLEALYQDAGDYTALGELWTSRAQALMAAERAFEAGPLLLKSARLLLERGDKAAGLQRLGAALEALPPGPEAEEVLERMARLQLDRGEKLEAAALYARKAALVPDGREGARLLLQAAELCSGTSREEALLTEALRREPTFAPARVRRADLRLLADPRGALEDIEAVLSLPEDTADLPSHEEQVALWRRAAFAAGRAGRAEVARRWLSRYCEQAQDDLEAWESLAALHREAQDNEALVSVLAMLWPRLTGEPRRNLRRELAERAVALQRPALALPALRSLREEAPSDLWAATALLAWLPPAGQGSSQDEAERLTLLSVLTDAAQGEAKADLLAQRARLHQATGRLEEARVDFTSAASLSAAPAPLQLALAELARTTGDEVAELAAWSAALTADASLAPQGGQRLLSLGSTLLAREAWGPARQALDSAVALSLSEDERCDAFMLLAELCEHEGQPEAQVEALAEAARQGPLGRRVEALLRRAHLLAASGAWALSALSAEQALSLSPGQADATELLTALLRRLERWSDVAALLATQAAQAEGRAAGALYAELASLYADRLSAPAQAEEALRKALQSLPKDAQLQHRLVYTVAARGAQVEAAQLLATFAESADPADAARLLREGASLAQEGADPALALKLARRAQSLVPAEGRALAELAELLYLQGAVAEALPLQEALAQSVDFEDPTSNAEQVLLRWGDLAEQTGDEALAQKAYRRLLSHRPATEAAAERLAALLTTSHPREAVEILVQQALASAPSEQTAQRLVQLSARAREALADVNLAATLLERAAAMVSSPLALRQTLASLYRESGRSTELLAELQKVATLSLEAEKPELAMAAYEERARLAEQMGHAHEALQTLSALRDVLAASGKPEDAALHERHRAELLRDVALDLKASEEALERSFSFYASADTARLGLSLSAQREDVHAQERWLQRALRLSTEVETQGPLRLELARLQLGALQLPEQAEATLREALRLNRRFSEAERLLGSLLEREGRVTEWAAWYEESAAAEPDAERRSLLLQRAAGLYRERAGRPDLAAVALLGARAATPDDAALTAQTADLLYQVGRAEDAASFDHLLLEADPFREPAFTRHQRYLEERGELQELATLMLWRAERQAPQEAAQSYLEAAEAFRKAGAQERALICEDQAFEQAPASAEAFERLRSRADTDPRRLAQLLAAHAEALSAEQALPLLQERAQVLLKAGEALLAAEALDAFLARAGDQIWALQARAELAAQAGGPAAAQPYDRRLLSLGDATLPLALRLKTLLRLAHASLASGAFHDAAESLEAVRSLDPEGPAGAEALSLLVEAHSRTGDVAGLYRASLELAARSQGPSAEALYRRAAALFDAPQEALEAWRALVRLRPSDARVIERAAEGLRSAGRHREWVEVFETGARAVGGSQASAWLLEAAQVVERELADDEHALRLRLEASEVAPAYLPALQAKVEALRRSGGLPLLDALEAVAQHSGVETPGAWMLELATLARREGQPARARAALEAIIARGVQDAAYGPALEALESLLADEPVRRAQVVEARAELVQGLPRAELWLRAAEAYGSAQAWKDAIRVAQAAVQVQADVSTLRLLSELYRSSEEPGKAAESLRQAARYAPNEQRVALLQEAAELWERAGENSEALRTLQQLAADFPEAMDPQVLAERYLRLGAAAQAVEVGFAAALARGSAREALALAERAGDIRRVEEASWALVDSAGPGEPPVQIFVSRLREQGRFAELLDVARRRAALEPALSLALYAELLSGRAPLPQRLAALDALRTQPDFPSTLRGRFASLPESAPEWQQAVLREVAQLTLDARREALGALAAAWPARASSFLRERFELEEQASLFMEAAGTLQALAQETQVPSERAALQVERGELLFSALDSSEQATKAFRQALLEDPQHLPAIEHLVSLTQPSDGAAAWLALSEQKEALRGKTPTSEEELSRRVEAYESLGRLEMAWSLLSELAETPARLQQRAIWAQQLGHLKEAVALRERLAPSAEALVDVLDAALGAGAWDAVVRIGTRLFEEKALPRDSWSTYATALALRPEGASLAVQLWKGLLQEQPLKPEAWASMSQAFASLGRDEEAQQAAGFHEALARSAESAPEPEGKKLSLPSSLSASIPEGAVRIDAGQMPRLHAVLSAACASLGAPELQLWMHLEGGPEAFLAQPQALVVGAGALAVFGPAELRYLCAVALALGEESAALAQVGPVPGLLAAAVEAYRAVPSPLAAARVLARLAPEVRGSEASAERGPPAVMDSGLFQAVALAALESL